jgi:arsenate reductase
MAEGLVNHLLGEGRWEAHSAGTAPTGAVHPLAVAAMRELDVDIAGQHSKSTDEFRDLPLDLVVTVCDDAAENCPVWLGEGHIVHAGFLDPAAAKGSRDERLQVFRDVRDGLRQQIADLLAQTGD